MSRAQARGAWADLVPAEPRPAGSQTVALQSLIGVMARRELMAQLSLALARGVLMQAEQSVAQSQRRLTQKRRHVADFRRDDFGARLEGPLGIDGLRLVLADESRLVDSAVQADQDLSARKAQAAEADAELKRKQRLLRLLAIRREKYTHAVEDLDAE